MSKFEQLLDLIVNEEHEKANELFHEIVVEKSREIYENLIAEEVEEEEMDESASEEDMDESADADEDDVEESADADEDDIEESADEEMDESEMDLEDSFEVEGGDEMGGDATDDLLGDVEADDEGEMGDEGEEAGEDQAIFDIKNAIADLEAAFADLEKAQGAETGEADFGDEEGDEEGEETDEMMGFMEGRRITREYVEKVGNDWEKNSQKGQGQYVGAGSGDTEGAPVEGKSPIASGKNKPGPAGVGAGNIAQNAAEGQSNTGTSPGKVNNGITKTAGEKFDAGKNGNVPGGKMGVKNLSKVAGGHGAEKKGSGPGPVGSGTGDKAGQTSVSNDKQFLKPYSK